MEPYKLLKLLLARDGLTPTSLARKLEKPSLQPQLSRYVNGKVAHPEFTTVQPVADFFGIRRDALLDPDVAEQVMLDLKLNEHFSTGGHGTKAHHANEQLKPHLVVRSKPKRERLVRPVFVVGKTQGGMPERLWDDGGQPVGAGDGMFEAATADEHAFACKVVGDSMYPRFIHGEYVLVEPGMEPEIEDDVLVRLSTGETMLKRLLGRRGVVRLGSYNNAEVLTYDEEQVTWIYYVAHSLPARKLLERVERVIDPGEHSQDQPQADDTFVGGDNT